MASSSHDGFEFERLVAHEIRRLFPELLIEIVSKNVLRVEQQTFNLDNLHRMIEGSTDNRISVIQEYLQGFFSAADAIDAIEAASSTSSFETIGEKVMLSIKSKSIFESIDPARCVHLPFVNGTVKVFTLDFGESTISLCRDNLAFWDVTIETVEEYALRNLRSTWQGLHIDYIDAKEPGARAIVINQMDGYDASRLLSQELHMKCKDFLGSTFYAAIPVRDMLIGFTMKPCPFVRRMKRRIRADYSRLPYPITDKLFIVTADGIAGTTEYEQKV